MDECIGAQGQADVVDFSLPSLILILPIGLPGVAREKILPEVIEPVLKDGEPYPAHEIAEEV